MQYISAVALASLSGKAPTKDSVVAILKATGKPVDQKEVEKVIASINNRPVHELIAKGITKVSSAAPAASSAPAKKEQKKQEKKPEKKEEKKPEPPAEQQDFGGIDLFG